MISWPYMEVLGYAKCPECNRVFDLGNEGQAQDWYYGHDCFIEEEDKNDKQNMLGV